VKEKSRNIQAIINSVETSVRREIPRWLEVDKENFKGVMKAIPSREDISMPIQEQLIVELYSK